MSSLPLAPPWNGADKNIARAIVRNDRESRFLVESERRECWPTNVRAIPVPVDRQPTLRSELLAARFVARYAMSADVVHIVASIRRPSRLRAAASRTLVHALRRPIIHTVPSLGATSIADHALPGDLTVVFSEHSAQRLTAAGTRNVIRLFPPLDLELLDRHVDISRIRQEHALGERAILCATHLGSEDGVDTLIHALAQLPTDVSDAVLVVAARWSSVRTAVDRSEALRRLASSLGVGGRLRILRDSADIPALLSASAVCVLVPPGLGSKMDHPLVVLESLALGRPVILSDITPLRDAALGGGLVVPPGDAAALARGLTDLLRDPALRESLGASGRANVRELGDPGRIAAEYRRLYRLVR